MQAMENSKIGQDTGSVARLHSSLMGLLSHLVRRLTRLGMDHPQIIGVLPFLLRHALNLSHPESEVLLEDGLQLLQIVLKRSDQLLPEYRVSFKSCSGSSLWLVTCLRDIPACLSIW